MRRDERLHGLGTVAQINNLTCAIPGREDDRVGTSLARGIPLAAEAEGKQLVDRILPI